MDSRDGCEGKKNSAQKGSFMTEDEAKTKWCPNVRFVACASDDLIPNRAENLSGDATRCIGSGCMAWRQTDNETFPCGPGMKETPSKPAGYCGLAGRP